MGNGSRKHSGRYNPLHPTLAPVEQLLLAALHDARAELKQALNDLDSRHRSGVIAASRRPGGDSDAARRASAQEMGRHLMVSAYAHRDYGDVVNTAFDDGYAQGVEDCLTTIRAYLKGLN